MKKGMIMGIAKSEHAALHFISEAKNKILNRDTYSAYLGAINACKSLEQHISLATIKHINEKIISRNEFKNAAEEGLEILLGSDESELFKKAQALVNHDKAAAEREGLDLCFELKQLEIELQRCK